MQSMIYSIDDFSVLLSIRAETKTDVDALKIRKKGVN